VNDFVHSLLIVAACSRKSSLIKRDVSGAHQPQIPVHRRIHAQDFKKKACRSARADAVISGKYDTQSSMPWQAGQHDKESLQDGQQRCKMPVMAR
jgi:hypothetical protein